MKFLFDLFPVALFFIAIFVWDIFVATAVAIAATIVQVGWLKIRGKKIQPMLWASLVIIVIFGGLTLYLRDKTFILWKPTVLYWLLGAVLAVTGLMGRNLIQKLLSHEVQLPDAIWSRLNWAWVGFFAALGCINLYIAFNYSEKIWATFKLFGVSGLMLLFIVIQAAFIARHTEQKQ